MPGRGESHDTLLLFVYGRGRIVSLAAIMQYGVVQTRLGGRVRSSRRKDLAVDAGAVTYETPEASSQKNALDDGKFSTGKNLIAYH